MGHLDFYFDFISPYAYFGFRRLNELPASITINLKPVLFAGLLGHWESKGPAEIAPKRTFTYQYTHWYAHKQGIPFRCPPAHPFNPLPGLRLALAANCTHEVVSRIFAFVWGEGKAFDDPQAFAQLTAELGIAEPETQLQAPEVKQALRDNTDKAVTAGVFGVPSYVIDEQVFWGVDAFQMAADYIADPAMMKTAEMQRLASLPASAQRKL
ncbi:MAG: 2-hydroxychromene-2-carboxylate isomerase [Pseudomonadota bacterium]